MTTHDNKNQGLGVAATVGAAVAGAVAGAAAVVLSDKKNLSKIKGAIADAVEWGKDKLEEGKEIAEDQADEVKKVVEKEVKKHTS